MTLSEARDPLGLPIAQVNWSAGAAARANLLRLGTVLCESFERAGLPALIPEPWVRDKTPEAATVIDLGHSLGTTRMSDDPRQGVVDRNCAVHGVTGQYAIGGSVFPTSGHANPTLMMLALTLRLAEHLSAKAKS